jgi:hypothetical protein
MTSADPRHIRLSLRLVLCANECLVGPRLHRGKPFPTYQPTYALEDRELAEADLDRVREYLIDAEMNPRKGRQ